MKRCTQSQAGFSMIEALVTLVILFIITLGMLTIFDQSQHSYVAQSNQAEKNRQLRAALDQIISYVRQAGSDPTDSLAVEPIQILSSTQIRINSDVTGSVASTTVNPMESTGDPDGTLNSIYEQVTVRYNPGNQQVLVDIGYGEQVIADDVVSWTLTFLNASGNVTTTESDIYMVRVQMIGQTSSAGQLSGMPVSVTAESQAYIRSRSG